MSLRLAFSIALGYGFPIRGFYLLGRKSAGPRFRFTNRSRRRGAYAITLALGLVGLVLQLAVLNWASTAQPELAPGAR